MSLVEIPQDWMNHILHVIRAWKVELPPKGVVAGGFLRDIVSGVGVHIISDVDIFIASDKESRKAGSCLGPPLDIVEVAAPTALTRVKEFDFCCCVAAVGRESNGQWWGRCHEKFMQDCANHAVTMNEGWNKVTLRTVSRLRKLLRRGWKISDTELAKVMRIVLGSRQEDVEDAPLPIIDSEELRRLANDIRQADRRHIREEMFGIGAGQPPTCAEGCPGCEAEPREGSEARNREAAMQEFVDSIPTMPPPPMHPPSRPWRFRESDRLY